jgi:hypothetical protein
MDADKSRRVRRLPTVGGADRVEVRRPRKLARPDLPVGPQRDVRDLLYGLHEQAGRPALADLEARIAGDDRLDGAPKKDLIHRIISRGGPARQDDVRAVARTLARACGQDEYAIAVQVAQLTEPSGQPTSSPVLPQSRVGRPVVDCDPLLLEVHPAVHVPGAGPDPLPEYVSRAHDTQLRAAVDELLVGGVSRLVTLVGGSSTGKTRACWELVQYLEQRQPGRWWAWHPYDPTRPDAALSTIADVGPRTVVWLNEAQHYLLPPNPTMGEQIAAALRTLMQDPKRGPVLVLATLWPEYWSSLTTRPPRRAARPIRPGPRSAGWHRHCGNGRRFIHP